ncbi:MAG: hypothetical protein ACTSXG_02690 [Alphaproteobacteria bacterium]
MTDWIKQLDTFLTMTGKEILQHSGKISHQKAIKKDQTYRKKIRTSFL